MWEEHPEYQKQQARLIGLLLAALVILSAGYAIEERDWNLLRQAFLFASAFVMVPALLAGFAWALIKLITRGRAPGEKLGKNLDP